MQAATDTRAPSALPRILLYIAAVMTGGALLAAPLFHLGHAVRDWIVASPIKESGPAAWLLGEIGRAHFTRYFNRAVLVCAIVFMFPLIRSLRITRGMFPVWRPWRRGLGQWAWGFGLAAGLLLVLGIVFLQLGAWRWRPEPTWWKLGGPLGAAFGAGIVEEFFFRGLLLGLLLRSFKTLPALLWTSFIFAIVHFLKPTEGWQIPDAEVTWLSGFVVLGQIARGFGSVEFLIAEFFTLFAVGWVLAQARMRTGALWASIGLHGGWVFGLKYFSALTFRSGDWLPWIGANLKIGIAPLVMVLFTGWLALRGLRPLVREE